MLLIHKAISYLFGKKLSDEEKDTIHNSYKTLEIVGRGTVYVSPEEVHEYMHKQGLFDKAEAVVRGNQNG